MKQWRKRIFALALAALLLIGPAVNLAPARADGTLVLTLGANLSTQQKQEILEFFNIEESDAMVIVVTNDDERRLLLGQYTEAQIGKKTYSCALVNPTVSGGIQVKTANMSVVTSGRIASILSTSGVTDCEVLAAAPFMVSGTGALTGVMMGYEQAVGTALDPAMQQMAIEESTTVSEIGETIGQNEATLVVNDIKIRIVRDKAKDRPEIMNAVDTTVQQVEDQLAQLAAVTGKPAPKKLDQKDHEKLYNYGEKISAMDYDYDSMKVTLQRVTANAAKEIGIDDPIMETFEDLSAEDVLPANSILRATNDESMGEEAHITATDTAALDDAPTMDAAAATTSWHGNTYALFDLPMNWTEARRYCRSLGGDLVSINTLEEQEVVQALAAQSSRDYSWLGAQYDLGFDRWYWCEGSSFNFSNWDENQPDGTGRGEYFLRMANRDIAYGDWTAHAGKWNDAGETGDADISIDAFGFICKIKEEPAAADALALPGNDGAAVTGVRLSLVHTVEGGSGLCNGTSAIVMDSDQGKALADLQGNLLTGYDYHSLNMYRYGLITAEAEGKQSASTGVLDQAGHIVVPCDYDVAEVVNNHWAIGIRLANATEADYDYRGYSGDQTQFYTIDTADVYYAADGGGTLVKSLTRPEYRDAEAMGDYINVEDRSGNVTTYDSTFAVVARDVRTVYEFGHIFPRPYADYRDDTAEHPYGIVNINGDVVVPAFADIIYDISDAYVLFGMDNGGGENAYGLAGMDGSVVLPATFTRIYDTGDGDSLDAEGNPATHYNCRGYYQAVLDDRFVYLTEGGNISCDTGVSKDETYVDRAGLALRVRDADERYTIYAADGSVTQLDDSCDGCWLVQYSNGLLWRVGYEDAYTDDLVDWHGNVLLSEYEKFDLSGDGNWLAARKAYGSPLEIYAVTYLYGDGGETAPEGAQPEEAAPAGSASEETVDNAAMVSVLENTIATIQKTDFNAGRDQIAQILEKEAGLLAAVNGDAAAAVTDAASIVKAGGGDADSVVLVLRSVVDMLR